MPHIFGRIKTKYSKISYTPLPLIGADLSGGVLHGMLWVSNSHLVKNYGSLHVLSTL